MTALTFLIPIALLLGLLGLIAFLWSLRTGQYDDLEGAAYRAVFDDDLNEKAQDTEVQKEPEKKL